MQQKPYDLLTILGPTATGKTKLAAHLAYYMQAEIISADSRQVYRGMDLGTGKDLDDYTVNGTTVPFHLVDIRNAGEKYNVFEFQRDFFNTYAEITQRASLPILCGGSGMYIEAVLKGYELIQVPVNEPLRAELETWEMAKLTHYLSTLKPLHNQSDTDTKKRAIRAIEIAMYQKEHPQPANEFPVLKPLIIGINMNRQWVKDLITQRLKQRLRNGMIDEVEQLLKKGVPMEVLVYYGLEYKFIALFLNKELSYNRMVEQLNVAIHQFSKRQMTFFRKMEKDGFTIHWIDGHALMEEKIAQILNMIHQNML